MASKALHDVWLDWLPNGNAVVVTRYLCQLRAALTGCLVDWEGLGGSRFMKCPTRGADGVDYHNGVEVEVLSGSPDVVWDASHLLDTIGCGLDSQICHPQDKVALPSSCS